MLNRLPLVNISSQTWLADPQLAMICCVEFTGEMAGKLAGPPDAKNIIRDFDI